MQQDRASCLPPPPPPTGMMSHDLGAGWAAGGQDCGRCGAVGVECPAAQGSPAEEVLRRTGDGLRGPGGALQSLGGGHSPGHGCILPGPWRRWTCCHPRLPRGPRRAHPKEEETSAGESQGWGSGAGGAGGQQGNCRCHFGAGGVPAWRETQRPERRGSAEQGCRAQGAEASAEQDRASAAEGEGRAPPRTPFAPGMGARGPAV